MFERIPADVSVILNLHCEAPYVRRTVRSLNEAAAFARENSICCELVVVFDRSDDLTKDVMHGATTDAFVAVRYVDIDHGSLGLARNSGIAESQGKYVWLCDADDLVSSNSIAQMYALAETKPRIMVFPEYLITFGERCWVAKYFDDSVVTDADFMYGHPYVSRVFANRQDVSAIGFKDLRVTRGFAYEDWLFNCEMRANGFQFKIASKTFLFYRQRKGSLLREADARSIRQIPHNRLFSPSEFCARVERESEKSVSANRLLIKQKAREAEPVAEIFSDSECLALMREAISIDPGINVQLIRSAGKWNNVFPDRHWGHNYADACATVGYESFTDIVLLPFLGPGGGEKYILEVLNALSELVPDFRCLVVSGQSAQSHPWIARLPDSCVFLDVFNQYQNISEDERDLLVLRLVLGGRVASTRLHMKTSPFVHRWFGKFSTVIGSLLQVVYYHFSELRVSLGERQVEVGWAFDFVSTEVSHFSLVVSDHQRMSQQDLDRFGVFQHRWRWLYAPCEIAQPMTKDRPDFRILWASRVSNEKRPDLLVRIVQAARCVFPQLRFVAAGMASDPNPWVAQFHATDCLEYLGAYEDFSSLGPDGFDAFLYTSAYDGLPNVVLEAMSHGLPVLSPDVGGLSEAVQNGKTGWLLADDCDDDALVESYVRAIADLYGDWEGALKLGQAGRELIAQRHSVAQHRKMVGKIFLGSGTR